MHLTPAELALATFLTIWLVFSAVAQLRLPRFEILRKYDLLSLIPQYNFFAPTPGTKDYHLLYRLGLVGGESFGPWCEVTPTMRRAWWNCFWNPYRRERKALFDISTTLARESLGCSKNGIQISIPYLVVLNRITQGLKDSEGFRRQYMLMISHGECSEREPQVLFISQVHGI